MLDHISINVTDLERSKVFYLGALGPLGYEVAGEYPEAIGFSNPTAQWEFSLRKTEAVTPTHIAFKAEERSLVDAFHAAGLKSGGSDNGEPGPRPQYHENYYAAFVLDPDGNNIEAVCHKAGR
jgi:catechol 2,3-dioxygenase-like lactoylglutathione lyase family enzyme